MKKVVLTNKIQLTMIKNKAEFSDIIPAGISLELVLAFLPSNFLSTYLLNAIAALLAVIMHISIKINLKIRFGEADSLSVLMLSAPRKKPIIAKGNAKMV